LIIHWNKLARVSRYPYPYPTSVPTDLRAHFLPPFDTGGVRDAGLPVMVNEYLGLQVFSTVGGFPNQLLHLIIRISFAERHGRRIGHSAAAVGNAFQPEDQLLNSLIGNLVLQGRQEVHIVHIQKQQPRTKSC
jgi:hypothetical protein